MSYRHIDNRANLQETTCSSQDCFSVC